MPLPMFHLLPLLLFCFSLSLSPPPFVFLIFILFFFRTVLSLWDFSHGKFGLLFPGKARCDRVALPNLRCMLGVLVFPQSTEL